MDIGFVTDSTVDLPDEVLIKEKIEMVPLYINIGEQSYLDKVEMSRANFYRNLASFSHHPTTATPGIDAFVHAYQKQVNQGASAILSFHISKVLSNTVDVARLASQKIVQVPVHIIDSGNLSLGTGLLLQLAVKMASSGEEVGEILKAVTDAITRTYTVAVLDTLEFLRRSGRLSSIQFGLGSLLFIKPIIKMNNGVIDLERIRTRKNAVKRLIQILEDLQLLDDFAFVHTHAPEKIEQFKQMVAGLIPSQQDTLTGEVTPVIGAHIGPGAFGFSAIAAK
ncbi:MAG TPA: hypothetical protein DCK95_05440 [Anaerolineaceae bacterium]|nr:hypothetical protein [Anaerolineaceae bacterium]